MREQRDNSVLLNDCFVNSHAAGRSNPHKGTPEDIRSLVYLCACIEIFLYFIKSTISLLIVSKKHSKKQWHDEKLKIILTGKGAVYENPNVIMLAECKLLLSLATTICYSLKTGHL